MKLELGADELLTTTRAVRRRLDFDRPVAREVLEECVEIAIQAPSGGDLQGWRWLLVSDPSTKTAIAEHYRRFYAVYREHRRAADPHGWRRVMSVADDYVANLERVPWFVIPCIEGPMGRVEEGSSLYVQTNTWGSIYPAIWSFMLALRERGLATCLTTNHLPYEREVADLLGIPFERVNQAGLLPVAYAQGTRFRRAPRLPLEEVTFFEGWGQRARPPEARHLHRRPE